MKGYLLIFFFIICLNGSAQQSKIDSLLFLLKAAKEDSNKVNIINELSWQFLLTGNYDVAKKYATITLNLAQKLNFRKGIANSYNKLGNIYYSLGNYSEALKAHFASLKIFEEMDIKKSIASCHNNIGSIYYRQGNFKDALKEYFTSLKVFEETGDKYGISSSINNIGAIYADQGNYKDALKEYLNSLKIKEEIGDKFGIADSRNNIGNLYYHQGKYNEALKEHLFALQIEEEIGVHDGVAMSRINIGKIYVKLSQIQKGKEELQKGLKIAQELGHMELLKDSYHGLAEADSILASSPQIPLQRRVELALSALDNYKMHIAYRDSLLNEENTKKSIQTQMQYEFDKKESATKAEHDKEIAVSESEKKKQRIIIYSVVSGLLLLALVAGIIFRSLKITRKQKHIISLQKEEVTKQREEIAHKNKDLTDSILYAERIQRAILTSEQYLNDMFLPQGQAASHFILYKPKDIVAGDFYWAYKTPKGKAIWLAADCTGHGVPGAFMSMIGNSLLNEIVIEKGIDQPAEILNNLRAGIIKAVGQSGDEAQIKDGMDAALCCWDKSSSKIIFSGANNSLWIIRDEEFIEIDPDKQPVGNYTGQLLPFTQKEYGLMRGDTLYTFTDGYCDQFGGPKGKKFKSKPFRELLLSIQDKTMTEQREILNKRIDEWRGSHEQIDDISVFGVRV